MTIEMQQDEVKLSTPFVLQLVVSEAFTQQNRRHSALQESLVERPLSDMEFGPSCVCTVLIFQTYRYLQ
jgi:hypothetical protein